MPPSPLSARVLESRLLAPDDLLRCFRKSDLKARIVLALSPDHDLYPALIAEETRSDCTSVLWALYGKPPYYSIERSLVGLGLVAERTRPLGSTFRLTERGRWAALVAHDVRRRRFATVQPPAPWGT